MSSLEKTFRRAGLSCTLRPGESTVLNTNPRETGFDLKLGREDHVYAVDPRADTHHLVLVVEEKHRGGKASAITHYLCGRDEKGCFISTLPGRPSSVHAAFEQLKPAEVREAERSGLEVQRQGEWFFIPLAAPPDEERLHRICYSEPIASSLSGNVHIVDELIRGERHLVEERIEELETEDRPNKLFTPFRLIQQWVVTEALAHGGVHHPDHRTLYLCRWHRVVRNNEVIPDTFWNSRPNGANEFID